MSKLYKVTLERIIYVTADDEDTAQYIARRNESAEIDNAEPDWIHASEEFDPTSLPIDWKDSLPYGGKRDLTCEQILKAQSEARLARIETLMKADPQPDTEDGKELNRLADEQMKAERGIRLKMAAQAAAQARGVK